MDIILASCSKRRSKILSSCGIKHKKIASGVKEITKGKFPERIVIVNALLKGASVARKLRAGYVIGADTVVNLGKEIIGKPRNANHAKKMLKKMSGKTIYVYTGLSLIDVRERRIIVDYEISIVKVRKIKEQNISKYFKLLGPYDKAGGFSIEGVGSFVFDNIKGSYFNVLGLPMAKLQIMFNKLGVSILEFIKV
ncbi:Maf family protein [Candidatus Omnitrophota bacterium]